MEFRKYREASRRNSRKTKKIWTARKSKPEVGVAKWRHHPVGVRGVHVLWKFGRPRRRIDDAIQVSFFSDSPPTEMHVRQWRYRPYKRLYNKAKVNFGKVQGRKRITCKEGTYEFFFHRSLELPEIYQMCTLVTWGTKGFGTIDPRGGHYPTNFKWP